MSVKVSVKVIIQVNVKVSVQVNVKVSSSYLDKVNVVFSAKSLNKLRDVLLISGFSQDAHESLTFVQHLD